MNKATIFDIIRNSFVDGPGIRTTVFFKGCNLRCEWCHNPESQSFEKQMMFYKNKCSGCGNCKEVCPYNLEKCDFCGKCELYCPNDARKICGKEMSLQDIFEVIVKDKVFYDATDGGVTFSGGECMLQINFLKEILKKCKENDIHTAVDTAGNVPWEYFEKVIPYTDLFLYDIKAITPEVHKKYIGFDNELILENFKKLYNTNSNIIVRIPVIGGANDGEEITKIKRFLSEYKNVKTELMPYHQMGEHKYLSLGRDVTKFYTPTNEEMERYNNL